MAVKIPKFSEKNMYQNHFVYRKSTCTSLRANSVLRLKKAMTGHLSYDTNFDEKYFHLNTNFLNSRHNCPL